MTPSGLLIDGLARAAESRPDEEAIAFADLRLSWSQWHDRVRRLTGALAARGISRGDRVAVVDRNHIACLEVILAAGALGAATVVVNWRLSGPELTYVLSDSAPRLIMLGIGLDDQRASIEESQLDVITVDADYERWLAQAPPQDADATVSPDDIALIIYTSGTTGSPKGAEFSHRGLEANSETAARLGAMGPGDRLLASMPLFHVGGAGAALSAIHRGVPITLVRDASPAAIVDAIEHGCTRAFLVPAVISTLLDAGPRERSALASLSLLTYGGAPIPPPLLKRALQAMPNTSFVQVYGMTETCGTVTTLSDDAHRDAGHPERLASAGCVADGTDVRVVDPDSLDDVPLGEVGELWFRTPKRMVGYLGQPEATAATIVEGGWVRTGDIGRIDDDGFIYVEDRLKDVIITGGENVHGPEVEVVLGTHPAVAEVAVIGVPDPVMGESVVAVVVAAAGAHVDEQELIAHARQGLARFKCPRAVVVVDALPRNASGKVLKRQLRERFEASRAAGS